MFSSFFLPKQFPHLRLNYLWVICPVGSDFPLIELPPSVEFLSRCEENTFPRVPYVGVSGSHQPTAAQNVTVSSRHFSFLPFLLPAAFSSCPFHLEVMRPGSFRSHLAITRPSQAVPPYRCSHLTSRAPGRAGCEGLISSASVFV